MLLAVDEKELILELQDAAGKLDANPGELVLDFSAVSRIDPKAVLAIEEFAREAENKAVRVILRGVNVDVYKVLKLVKVAPRYSFVA
jgi:anti-anti-sigma regulatory factor